MDYQRFFEFLPSLYKNWAQEGVRPKSERFQKILEQIQGSVNENIMQLLNFAVACMENEEVYCEIGCFSGASLIGALLDNPEQIAYSVNILPDVKDTNKPTFIDNISIYELEDRVILIDGNLEEFFALQWEMRNEDKIGVYFYNGATDYRSQLMGLLLVKPFLASRALLVIGNSDLAAVKQAIWDFMAANRNAEILLDLSSASDEDSKFGNGIQVLRWDIERENNYRWSKIGEAGKNSVIESMDEVKSENPNNLLKNLYKEAVLLDISEEVAKATATGKRYGEKFLQRIQKQLRATEVKYKQILQFEPNNGEVLLRLSKLYYVMEQYQDSLQMLLHSLEIEQRGIQYYILGLTLERMGDIPQAMQAYQAAIAKDSLLVDAYNNLGNLLLLQEKLEEAESVYRAAIAANPEVYGSYQNLGNILMAKQEPEAAIPVYQKALQLSPKNYDILCNLCEALQKVGKTGEVIELASETCLVFPEDLYFKLIKYLTLPNLYENPEEIKKYRIRFQRGLEKVIQQTNLDTNSTAKNALKGIESYSNFYLAYQGKNDLKFQEKFGDFVYGIMKANYPQYIERPPMPPLTPDGKIRIGYISDSMRANCVGKLFLGWIRNFDREQFEVYCYYIHPVGDELTEQFLRYSNRFYHISNNFDAICEQIVADRLHVLVFPDIGMNPLVTQMAALRLAPIQCTTWAHPVTSGLPTIDYFLSSDLMEPDNAEKHYSERLIRLPKIGFSCAKPMVPQVTRTRFDFELREEAVVYLSCQSLSKHLPQHDYLFAAIAQRVTQAQFVFLASHESIQITEKFQQRLHRNFAKEGLKMEQYCAFVPRSNYDGYLNLMLASDIFLDSLSWSGGLTTLDAVACNLPIVTCPGELMRGRHSYGILKTLGVTETIANSEAEYIEIAVRLALDTAWRDRIAHQIKQRHCNLYDDKVCVAALEEFYQQVVEEHHHPVKGLLG